MKISKVILFIILITFGFSCNLLGKQIVDKLMIENQKWDSENKCISELIVLGIERNTIVRNNGSCYIK